MVSPDGKWLYYVSPGDMPKALWKVPFDGKGKPVKVMKHVSWSIISPTHPKRIASFYYDEDEKEKNPWKYILYEEGNSENWKDLGDGQILDWAADGSGIYYANKGRGFNNVGFISTETFEKKQITNFKDMIITGLDISPDGKSAVLTRGAITGNVIKVSGFKLRKESFC